MRAASNRTSLWPSITLGCGLFLFYMPETGKRFAVRTFMPLPFWFNSKPGDLSSCCPAFGPEMPVAAQWQCGGCKPVYVSSTLTAGTILIGHKAQRGNWVINATSRGFRDMPPDRISPHMLGRKAAPSRRHFDGDTGPLWRTMPVSYNAGSLPSVQAGR